MASVMFESKVRATRRRSLGPWLMTPTVPGTEVVDEETLTGRAGAVAWR